MAKTLKFGQYIQSKDERKDLTWIILKEDGKKALLISKQCIAGERYHDEADTAGTVTWETCSLRKWLNGTFCKDAFSPEEQQKLQTVGEDQVFLLSKKEIEKYIPQIADRKAKPTDFAKKSADIYTANGYCPWYMRDPSEIFVGNSTAVKSDGTFDMNGGDFVLQRPYGVRPAILITLED